MMDSLLDQLQQANSENSELKKLNQVLKAHRKEALRHLENLESEKKKLEIEMLNKFSLILNEKKNKIRQLRRKSIEESHQIPTYSTYDYQKSDQAQNFSNEQDKDLLDSVFLSQDPFSLPSLTSFASEKEKSVNKINSKKRKQTMLFESPN